MIVGNGDIASVIEDKEGKLFFASGVSNSRESRNTEFRRERELLLEQNTGLQLVYFSSLAVFDSETPYLQHKRAMELLIKDHFPNYCIFRIGNISWGNNPNTIINYFKHRIQLGEAIEVQDVYRHVVDLDEFLYWVNLIPDWSCEMAAPGRMYKVSEIVQKINEGVL